MVVILIIFLPLTYLRKILKKNEKMILNTLDNISKTGSAIKSIADTSFLKIALILFRV